MSRQRAGYPAAYRQGSPARGGFQSPAPGNAPVPANDNWQIPANDNVPPVRPRPLTRGRLGLVRLLGPGYFWHVARETADLFNQVPSAPGGINHNGATLCKTCVFTGPPTHMKYLGGAGASATSCTSHTNFVCTGTYLVNEATDGTWGTFGKTNSFNQPGYWLLNNRRPWSGTIFRYDTLEGWVHIGVPNATPSEGSPMLRPGRIDLPEYFPAADPFALPIQQPVPTPRPLPYRALPRRLPRPDRVEQPEWGPVVGRLPRGLGNPGSAIVSLPGGGRAIRPASASGGLRRPPRRDEKEKKAAVAAPAALMRALGYVTEGLDLLFVAFEALPPECKAGVRTGGAAIQAVWDCWQDIDPEAFILGLIENQAEDAFFGRVGNRSKRAARDLAEAGYYWSPVGFQAGPAL